MPHAEIDGALSTTRNLGLGVTYNYIEFKAGIFNGYWSMGFYSLPVDISDEWITSRTGIKQRHEAAEGLTRYVDYTDRSTCVIFGDGASAAIRGWRIRSNACFHYNFMLPLGIRLLASSPTASIPTKVIFG